MKDMTIVPLIGMCINVLLMAQGGDHGALAMTTVQAEAIMITGTFLVQLALAVTN